MKKKLLFTTLFSIFLLTTVFSQDGLYYYGYKTKYTLETDSLHAIIIPLTEKAVTDIQTLANDRRITHFIPINNRKEILVSLRDKSLLIETRQVKDYILLPVYYRGTIPLRPTAEIIFKPYPGFDYNDILEYIGSDQIQLLRSKKHDVYVVRPNNLHKLLQTANQIYESGLVDWCEPNFLIEIEKQQTINPEDPLYPQQYYLSQANNIDINAPQAWSITSGLCPVRVAVIDDGVEAHEDLLGRVVAGFTPLDPNGFGAPTTNLPPVNEGIIGHGQACAGIIGASHNTVGTAGIFPSAEIVPINIFNSWYLNPLRPVGQRLEWLETAENIADAINWAWDEGEAEVLSNSWGSPIPGFSSAPIIQAISNARIFGRGGLGSVVVFSSGNSHGSFSGVAFPGNVDGVVVVGAIDRNGNIWDYSSRGPELDLVAPSGDTGGNGDVVTIDRMGNLGYDPGNYTDGFGGTSAAAPQVSGVAALMLSINPGMTESQVKTILQNTATDMGSPGFDNIFGYGRLNASAALQPIIPSVTGPDVICSTGVYTLTNLPTGATVTSWSAEPAIYTDVIGGGTSATLTKLGTYSGLVTLTATVNTLCNSDIQIKKSVHAGSTGVTQLGPYDPSTHQSVSVICEGNTYYFVASEIAPPAEPGTTYTWTLIPPPGHMLYPTIDSGPQATFFFEVTGEYNLILTKTSSCGEISESRQRYAVNCN